MSDPDQSGGSWTLLTGHGHVLVEIARNPGARIRDISQVVGLTERTVQAIVANLEAAGYLTRTRAGRRVLYTVNRDCAFRHSAQEGLRIGPFLDVFTGEASDTTCEQPATPPSQKRAPSNQLSNDRGRERQKPADVCGTLAAGHFGDAKANASDKVP